MDKLKEFIKDKKKLGIVIGVIVVILIVLLGVFVIKPVFSNKETTREKYERYLKEMGKDFWENYFYDTIKEGERNDFLSKYQSIGIKVDLDSLGRYKSETNKEKIAEMINPETKEACNHSGTRVIIYPKGGFSKAEYDLEVEIDCGLEQNDNK